MTGPQGLFKALGKTPGAVNKKRKLNFYRTPEAATVALLEAERRHLPQVIWDPGVGVGDILHPFIDRGYQTRGSDIVNRWGDDRWEVRDFFDFSAPPAPGCGVVCNPDFDLISVRGGGAPWLEHCFALQIPYIAMLVPATWIHAKSRIGLLEARPPSRYYPICWRLDWTGAGAPAQSHAWIVWEEAAPTWRMKLLRQPGLSPKP